MIEYEDCINNNNNRVLVTSITPNMIMTMLRVTTIVQGATGAKKTIATLTLLIRQDLKGNLRLTPRE